MFVQWSQRFYIWFNIFDDPDLDLNFKSLFQGNSIFTKLHNKSVLFVSDEIVPLIIHSRKLRNGYTETAINEVFLEVFFQ